MKVTANSSGFARRGFCDRPWIGSKADFAIRFSANRKRGVEDLYGKEANSLIPLFDGCGRER
jgi:hypothetical protein